MTMRLGGGRAGGGGREEVVHIGGAVFICVCMIVRRCVCPHVLVKHLFLIPEPCASESVDCQVQMSSAV